MEVESVVDPRLPVAAAVSAATQQHTTQQHAHAHASAEFGASHVRQEPSALLATVGAVLPLPPTTRMTGIATSYSDKKGFGFIRSDYDGQEYFVHTSRLTWRQNSG